MSKYDIESKELDNIMTLLRRIFDIRITFFDLREREIPYFHIKDMTPYCKTRRRDPEFHARCVKCDTGNLVIAKKTKAVHIYRCHDGLLEGILPLHNKQNNYLGAIVFGQLRELGAPVPAGIPAGFRELYRSIPEFTEKKMADIGNLLKYLSEYIIENELIKYRNRPWAEKVRLYIESNIKERLTLAKISKVTGRSPTFVSHHFEEEFGAPPKRYILRKKMGAAMRMIKSGESVYNTARELSFYDEFHFSKAFKAYWGKAPKFFKP
jgi:AraC-like DNA-binding protein